MDFEFEDFDFHDHRIEQIDISFDEDSHESDLLKDIFDGEKEQFLQKVQYIINDKQKSLSFKKQVSSLTKFMKESFYNNLYKKVVQILKEVFNGNHEVKIIKEAGIIDFVLNLDVFKCQAYKDIFDNLKLILKEIEDYGMFTYIFACLINLSKDNDKIGEVSKEIFELLFEEKSSFKIKTSLKNCSDRVSQEKKYLLELKLIDFLRKNENLNYKPPENIVSEKLQVLKLFPYKKLLQYVIQHQKNDAHYRKLKNQVLDFSFYVENDKIKLTFNTSELHPELLNSEVVKLAFRHSDQKILSLLNESIFQVNQEKLYTKFTIDMLKNMEYAVKHEQPHYIPQNVFSSLEVIKKVAQNFGKILVTFEQNEKMQEENNEVKMKEYFGTLIHIFTKYFSIHERSHNMSQMREKLSEDLILRMLKIGDSWLESDQNKDYCRRYAYDILSILSLLFYRRQFQFLTPYRSQVSKLLISILMKLKLFPKEWKKLRKIKAILDRWGETVAENCPYFPQILRKFFDYFFMPEVNVKLRNTTIFHPMFASRTFLKIFVAQSTDKILYILKEKLKIQDLDDFNEEKFKNASQYLYKISLFFSSKIKLPENDKAGDFLYRLYQNYAAYLPILYNFRTWIVQNSNLAKDNVNASFIENLFHSLNKQWPSVLKTFSGLNPDELLSPRKNLKSEDGKIIDNFIRQTEKLINSLELKSIRDNFESSLYQNIIKFCKKISTLFRDLQTKILTKYNQKSQFKIRQLQSKQLNYKKYLIQNLYEIQSNLQMIPRFYLCNILRLISAKEQVYFLKNISTFITQIISQQQNIGITEINFLTQILGLSNLKRETHFQKTQILKINSQRQNNQNEQYSINREDFIPINIVSVIYAQIRPVFTEILKKLISFTEFEKKQKNYKSISFSETNSVQMIFQKLQNFENISKENALSLRFNSRALIKSLLFPSMNLAGECYYNNKFEPKGKEQYAFGILDDQFTSLYNSSCELKSAELNPKEISCLSEQILSLLEVCQGKDRKITEKNQGLSRDQGRNRHHPRIAQQITLELQSMGCSQEQVEIALQHIDHPDPELAFEWIQTNLERIQDIITNRVLQQSKTQNFQKRESQNREKNSELFYLPYHEFLKNMNKGTKKLIKLLAKEMFHESGNKIKDLIFVCLNSFQDKRYKAEKYKSFLEMIIKELDTLNSSFNEEKLDIIAGSIDIISVQIPDLIIEIHEKYAPLKLLSFVEKVTQQVGQKILRVVNKTLPVPSEGTSPKMIDYMRYISDILLQSQIKSNQESQILFKMIKAKDKTLSKKVLNVVCKGLGKGCIKRKIFPLITILLDSQGAFSAANIELDLKMFIIQNHNLKNKENLLQVDARKFAKAFVKHEENSLLNELCHKLLVKKKGKTHSLYFDKCKHSLFYSEILNCHFLSYDLPSTPKIILESLVKLIVDEENESMKIEYIEQLYKTLQFHKIAIPYCLQVEVNGTTFFEWLLRDHFPKNRGSSLPFLTFLFVRNALFFNEDYTYSDYLIAQFLKNIMEKPTYQKNIWILVEVLYFLMIQNFNKKVSMPISRNNQLSLQKYIEQQLTIKDPLNYLVLSQCLYLIYKRQIIQTLTKNGKYRLNDQGEYTLEKQFLHMDLFYKKSLVESAPVPQQNRSRQALENLLMGLRSSEEEDLLEDEQSLQMNIRSLLMGRGASSLGRSPPVNISSILSPITPPKVSEQKNNKDSESKEKEEKIQEEKKTEYLEDIYNTIQAVLPKYSKPKIQFEDVMAIIPKEGITSEEVKEKKFAVKISEPRTQLGQKFSKTQAFKQRVSQIVKIIDPEVKWGFIEEKSKTIAPELRSRTLEQGGYRPMLMLERLILREQLDQPRNRQQGNQQLNMGRIMNIIEEYQQPEKIIEKSEEKEEEKPEEKQVEKEEDKQKNKEGENKEGMDVEEKEEEKPKIEVAEERGEVEQMVDRIEIQPPQQEGMIPEIQHIAEQPAENRGQRQVLTMLGLPQTFLQDVGIDPEFFDSLPEDMQIEQLNHFMNEQQRAAREANQSNANQAPNIQNQNAIFIASLDPQLRAQTLMEATPEFLMTLPPELRAQAENQRQRFIRNMLQQEQEEEEQLILQRKQRIKKNLIYPDLDEKIFSPLDPKVASELLKSIFLRLPNYKNEPLRSVLENKSTQKVAITTLISTIKNIENVEMIEHNYNEKEKKWELNFIPATVASGKLFISKILDTIHQSLTTGIYFDAKFLQGKYTYENYFKNKFPVNTQLDADQEGYFPIFELLDLSLDFNKQNLAAELIKRVKEIPYSLCVKVVREIRDDKLSDSFYKNMKDLAENQKLKECFMKEFTLEKPPKFEVLAKILNYEFSRLPFLKKLHIEGLKKFTTNRTQIFDFLNEIYRAYTVEDLQQIEDILVENKATHFHIIKHLYANGKSLDDQPIGIILKFPHLLDFETKRFLFQNHPKILKQRGRFIIEVNRMNIFQESYNQIMSRTPRELQGKVKVVFTEEQAQDAGGVKKEWFLAVSKQIFNAQYALFYPSSSGNTYQPNPKSYVNPEHLNYFKFIGRFVAKALSEGMLIEAYFTRSFYKMILGQELEFQDLEEQDYKIYESMKWYKQNKIDDDCITFSYEIKYFGKIITKELIPGGENIFVTEQNKTDYIHKYSQSMMRDSINIQIQKFLEGFYEILPKECISFFEAKELELLMSGMPTIDLNDLKQNTEYQGYSPEDNIIKWYWEVLSEYSNEDLAKLVQFITGTSKIPLDGFSELQGMNGPQKISIHRDANTHQLPKSHTCFNQLDLPNYPSKETLKEKLRVVLTWGSEGFGFL